MSDKNDSNKASKLFVYSVMGGMLVFGTANTIVQDLQNETYALGNKFTHPYMQTGMMFAGELSVFIVYGFKKWQLKREAAKKGPNEAPMSPVARQAGEN